MNAMIKLLLIFLHLFIVSDCLAAKLTKEAEKQIYKTTLGVEADEVIIGDTINPSTFKPQITLTRWNKENSLTIKVLDGMSDSSSLTSSIDELEIKDTKMGFYFKPDPDNPDNFKFGIILYEKPLVNSWSFQLVGWEEFDFFYQPSLANKNPDGSTWEDNGLGGTANRPVDVAGSYAVYHKTKKDHITGQTNYETGKFCHIYRPKFIDANGNWTWADLNIDKENYTITIPQKFLDTAVCPIKANDTFGYTTIGASSDTNADIQILCYATSTPASSGTLNSVSFHAHIYSTGSPELNPALYSDVTGTPTTRLAYLNSGGTVCGADYAWVTTNLSYGSITSGTQYWIGMKSGVAGVNYEVHYDTATNEVAYNTGSSWADPFVVQGNVNQRRSVYATYTASGGAARRIIMIQ